jgi:hypothetical protein
MWGELDGSVCNTRIFIDLHLPRLGCICMMPGAFLMCAASASERVLAEPLSEISRSPRCFSLRCNKCTHKTYRCPYQNENDLFIGKYIGWKEILKRSKKVILSQQKLTPKLLSTRFLVHGNSCFDGNKQSLHDGSVHRRKHVSLSVWGSYHQFWT